MSTAVFAGKAVERKFAGPVDSQDAVQVAFQVSTVWKGPVQNSLVVTTAISGASCGYEFSEGQRYFVYAGGSENHLRVSLCTRTRLVSDAGEDLATLGNGILLSVEDSDVLSYLSAIIVFLGAGIGVMMAIVVSKKLGRMRAMKIHPALNPVLVKEMRGRMRGPRAYLILTATLAFLGAVSYGLYRIAAFSLQSFGGGTPPSAVVGPTVFIGLVFLALIVICAISPALTAGAISGEHERKTFDLLVATPLHPASILIGKLAAAMSYVALILTAAVPLVSLSFVFGGVTAIDMLQALLLLMGIALTYSVMALFFSSWFRRTGPAVVASYGVVALFVVGSVFVYAVVGVIRQQPPPNWLLALNPFSALASVLAPANPSPGGIPFSGLLMPLLWFMGGGNFNFNPGAPLPRPLWQYTVGAYTWLTIVLYLVSTQLVKPVRRFRFRVRTWAIITVLFIASILAAPVVYGPFTPDRLVAAAVWSFLPPRNLVANGKFDSPLEPRWEKSSHVERGDESEGEVKLVNSEGRQGVRFSRTGKQHADIGITQMISQSVPADGWLQVRAVVRVESQDLPVCGMIGTECPLMIKILYDDSAGSTHEWLQGFYALPGDDLPFCGACEIKHAHIRVPQGKWYTFESLNMLNESPDRSRLPRIIRSITISSAGHSYEAEVAEVALLVRDVRPPDFGTDSMGFPATGFPTPTPAPPIFAPRIAPPVAPPIRAVPPPPPPPTPVPTRTQAATPASTPVR